MASAAQVPLERWNRTRTDWPDLKWWRDEARRSCSIAVRWRSAIIGVAAGLAINGLGLAMPAALDTTLELLARIALPLGLLLVGAGLRIRMPGKDVVAVFAASFVKLLVMPLFLGVAAWATGMRGADLSAVVLCGAGPSAMNAYLLAKQMGGDAPLFAAMVTAQTVLSFVTIPLVMALAQWMAG